MGRITDGGATAKGRRARVLAKSVLANLGEMSLATHVRVVSTTVRVRRFWRDESGAAGIEYGLIIVGISIAILSTIFAIGSEMNEYFQRIDRDISNRMAS